MLGHHLTLKDAADPPPRNYFVPHFGEDPDIKAAKEHIAQQEKRLAHAWNPKQDDNGVWIVPEAADNSSYSYDD